MKRLFFIPTLLLLLSPAWMAAQETAAGGQDTTTPSSTSTNAAPAPGLLTPPPDNAPVVTAPVPAPPASTATPTVTTTTARKSGPQSRREIARVQQQEIIRRQELIFQANQALGKARSAEKATQFPVARQNYLFATQALGSISRGTVSYQRAAEGLARVDLQLYTDALQRGDTAQAKILIDEVVEYNPNNKVALEKQAITDRAIADPNDTSILGNPAVTPGFVKRVNEVQELFYEAEQYRRTGQYDEAEAHLKRILGIDPYNIAATKQLERVVAEKNKYADHARLETRDERLRQVEEKFYEPITNKDVTTTAQQSQPTLKRETNFDQDQKLRNISVTLDFSNATIEEATNFLSSESKRLDEPDHKGVNFIIQPTAAADAKPISLTLNNVPLVEALRYICQLANVKYKVQDYAISIVPVSQSTEDLINRTFIVEPNFVAPPASTTVGDAAADAFGARRPVAPVAGGAAAAAAAGSKDTVQAALEAKGVKFPPGASAVYTPTTGQLSIVNTADQMELIEELVNAGMAPTLMVQISTKFVEINQDDLNDLTVNTAFNLFNPEIAGTSALGAPLLANGNPMKLPAFGTGLRGAGGFSSNNIDQLISPRSLNESQLNIKGFISGLEFNVVFQALAQKRSFDLLSEPHALVKAGEQATLESIRVFPYPTAFDPPELVQQTQNNNAFGFVAPNPPTVIPTTPTDFKRRNLGVRLVIKPQVVQNNKTVDLSLFPEVTEFDGFINYGSEINVGNPDGSTSLLSPNTINQPVFNTRRINTKVLIRDGSTVVLGGLIRDDISTINDKVPILGDIPLVGRLFQSKATHNTKRNLIVFVSANIFRNDGELLNPPDIINAADVLTGHASLPPVAHP